MYRRWQDWRLLQLAHQLFDHKLHGSDELVERRALVRSKVLDLSARIAASDLRPIGAGAFGGVSRGRLVEVDSVTGAILRVEDVVVKKPLRVTVDAQMENMQEISLLMGLPRHRHVLGLLGAYTSTDNMVCAVTPFMAGGSLEAQMEAHVRDRTQWAWLTQPMQVAVAVHDMFAGLLHLHTHNIMHRDCTFSLITKR
jgi:serine/threonine protein kinase